MNCAYIGTMDRSSLFDCHYWAAEMIVFVFFGRQVDIGLIKKGARDNDIAIDIFVGR